MQVWCVFMYVWCVEFTGSIHRRIGIITLCMSNEWGDAQKVYLVCLDGMFVVIQR